MCDAVVPGVIELLAITCAIGVFNITCAVFAVCFVLRNKIVVPQFKNTKQYEEKYRQNTFNEVITGDIVSKYRKYGVNKPVKKEQPLNMSISDTLILNQTSILQE